MNDHFPSETTMPRYPLLISSHSEAVDLWPITAHFLQKNFPTSLFKIYLGANGEHNRNAYAPSGWNFLYFGRDESFSKSLHSYLEAIEDEYVLLMLDDFVILERTDPVKLTEAFRFLRESGGVYLRLVPNPGGDHHLQDHFYRINIAGGAAYATSLQMAIWNRRFLMKLLSYDFSPWEFEIKAGKTAEALEHKNDFYVSHIPIVHYTHIVEKGKFFPFLRQLIEEEGLVLESSRAWWTHEELQQLREHPLKAWVRSKLSPAWHNRIRRIFFKEPL